jgi:hypothetical protein
MKWKFLFLQGPQVNRNEGKRKKNFKKFPKKLQLNSQKRPKSGSGSEIIKKRWIRIRIKSMQIRNPGKKPKLAKLQFAILSQNAVHFVRYNNVPTPTKIA